MIPMWLVILLPPLLGAVIGFVTNALAIRMLFRPLRKKYLFGRIPIPLTPGVIPHQREKLAHSIARMINRTLFNAEVIIKHIQKPSFQESLNKQLAMFFDGKREHVITTLDKFLLPLFRSQSSQNILHSIFGWIGRRFGSLKLDMIVPFSMRNTDNLVVFFHDWIEGEGFRRVVLAVVHWLRKQESNNIPIGKIFPPRTISGIFSFIDKMYIPAINFLLDFLRRKDIRRELNKRGKVILSDVLTKLNPFQRIVVSAGQYDRTIEENMPTIVFDLIKTLEKSLRSKENRKQIISALHDFIEKMLQRSIKELEEEYDIRISKAVYQIMKRIRTLVIREGLAEVLAEQISQWQMNTSLDDLLTAYGEMNLDETLTKVYQILLDWTNDEHKKEQIGKYIIDIILPRSDRTINKSDIFPNSLLSSFTEILNTFIEESVPSLVGNFNIYQMVVDRINGLDVEEVESLLMTVISEHLRYINILGAVLGGIIGAVQLLISLLPRS